jgi:hypothetical protein
VNITDVLGAWAGAIADTDHERLFFQEIAWQSVQEFRLISETAK